MSLSSEKLEGMSCPLPNEALMGRTPRHVATSNQLCLDNALELFGLESWISPGKRTSQMSLVEKGRDRVSPTSVKQVMWLIERCQVNKWVFLENTSRFTDTDWKIYTYQHLANWVTLNRCLINTCWIIICVYVYICIHKHTHTHIVIAG